MSSYDTSQTSRRARRNTRQPSEPRESTQTKRTSRGKNRSVGAAALSASAANAIGLSRRNATRPYDRGETVRRVEASRKESVSSRPAVYTAEPEKRGILGRIHLPSLSLPSFDVSTIPAWLVGLVALAIALVVLYGPSRMYYAAWRDAGVLHAEYEALAMQNDELNHEIERLQTLEGIEDEARSRGYVYPDEEALVVQGLEEEQVADPALVDAAVEEYQKSLPWYVGILDLVFGYSYE